MTDRNAAIAAGTIGLIVGIAIGGALFSQSFDDESLIAQRYLRESASTEELCRALADRRLDGSETFYNFCIAAAPNQTDNR